MIVTIEVKTQLEWKTFRTDKGERRWVGVCDAMNLSAEADSLDDLHSVIAETIHCVLLDLIEDNEFDRYLLERGWRANNVPGQISDDVQFNLPWGMNVAGIHDSERRAH